MEKIPDEINKALGNPEIPRLYSNSFSCALGQGDVVVLFKNGPNPVATLNLSYTMAKTLVIKLQGLISHLESLSGNKIMTSDDILSFIKKEMGQKKDD